MRNLAQAKQESMTQRNKNISGEGIIINDAGSAFFDLDKRVGYLKTLVRGRDNGI
jgi:hypothetical protein